MAATFRIDVEARYAQAIDALEKIGRTAETAGKRLNSSFGKLTPTIGIETIVRAVIDLSTAAITSAANLDDMAEKTGSTVEELSKLAQVARVSGEDLGLVEQGMIRLAVALSKGDEESQNAAKALKAIGLSAKELEGLDTAESFRRVAVALNGYADGAGKTAVVQALLGKSGAQLLPFIKDLAESGQKNATVTSEQAAQAEKLQKEWNAMIGIAADFGRSITLSVLPALSRMIERMTEGIRIAGGFGRMLFNFGQINPFKNIDENIEATTKRLSELEAKREEMTEGAYEASKRSMLQRREYLQMLRRQTETPEVFAGDIEQPKPQLRPPPFTPKGGGGGRKAKDVVTDLERDAKKATEIIRALETELANVGATEFEQELRRVTDSINELAALSPKERESRIQVASSILAQKTELKGLIAANDEENKIRDALLIGLKEEEDARRDVVNAMLEQTPTGQIDAALAKQQQLLEFWGDPKVDQGKLLEALDQVASKHGEVTEKATTMWDEAARNIQDAMADTFFDFMQGELDNVGDKFKRLIDRMIAEALAAELGKKLFGDLAKGGADGGGWIGALVNAVVGGFAGAASGGGGGGSYFAYEGAGYAKGAAFDRGNVIPLARGGVVNKSTMFPVARGTGMMGESGPEAVMPLARDSSGRLGVRGSGGVSITQNIQIDSRTDQAVITLAMAQAKEEAKAELRREMSRRGPMARL